MTFQIYHVSIVALADFAVYKTGKWICNNELSIICWQGVLHDSRGGFGILHLISIFSPLMANKPRKS